MIHVFKKGGERGVPPNNYSIECINEDEDAKFLADGWFLTLPDALGASSHAQSADTDGDGKLSHEEAKVYLAEAGVEYEEGLHWKKVVALAEQHMKGE